MTPRGFFRVVWQYHRSQPPGNKPSEDQEVNCSSATDSLLLVQEPLKLLRVDCYPKNTTLLCSVVVLCLCLCLFASFACLRPFPCLRFAAAAGGPASPLADGLPSSDMRRWDCYPARRDSSSEWPKYSLIISSASRSASSRLASSRSATSLSILS